MADEERRRFFDKLSALERQTGQLQRELRQLRAEFSAEQEAERTSIEEAPPTESRRRTSEPRRDVAPAVTASPDSEAGRGNLVDLEFWLGGRGLLLVGVVALVLAVSLFVKYAIDQGWIGPAARVLLGGGVGVAVIITGERLRAAGYRTYGLWLAAGGFGAIYVSIWAAVVLYQLLPTVAGLVLMAAVVAVAGALGIVRKSQALVALAAFGGYLAPPVLQVETGSELFRLAYLGILSGAALAIARREEWSYLAGLGVLGGALMTLPGGGDAPHLFAAYLVALMASALFVARRVFWPDLALLAVIVVWAVMGAGIVNWGLEGLTLAVSAAALWVASLVGLLGKTGWSSEGAGATASSEERSAGRDTSLAEVAGLLVLVLPPATFFLLAWVGLGDSGITAAREVCMLLGFALGAFYLVVARNRLTATVSERWCAWLGYAFLLLAPVVRWSGIGLVRAWLLESVALSVGGGVIKSARTRSAGLLAAVLGVLLYADTMGARPQTDAAFISRWALTGLALVLILTAWPTIARLLDKPSSWESDAGPIVALGAAVLFLGWGTLEIGRFYDLLSVADASGSIRNWDLARDLSISGFWIAYAGALLIAGFKLQHVPLRWAGLVMAFAAAAKVFLYDLSNLAQLYRIVSFVLLAAVLLGLSFGYQKLRKQQGAG